MSLTYHQQRLADLRDQYTNRRSVARELLDRATGLVDSALTEMQARHEMQLAEADRQHQRQLDRAEQRATDAADRVRQLKAMRTNLRETRETIDDGVLVKITAPRTVKWDGQESGTPRPWTLGELETLIYRLRAGGGTDDTEVRVKHDHTEATIPFPELVMEPPTKPKPAAVAETSKPRWWHGRFVRRWGVAIAIGVTLNLLTLLAGWFL